MQNKFPLNPFTQRGVIRDHKMFFGRHAELAQLYNQLRAMQSVSVVGERRIGKSSLLFHLADSIKRQLDSNTLVIYTDLPSVKDEQSFYKRVCKELDSQGDNFFDLEQAVRYRKVVICLDEFEKVPRQYSFSRTFFDALRSLAQSGNLAFVIATQHSLADLCRDENIATSPFWNIFFRLDLGLFSPQEAETFIVTRFNESGYSATTDEIARILQLAGRFPFFLQLGCYQLFEMKVGRTRAWEELFEKDAADHLRYLWECLKPVERKALRYVLGLGGRVPEEHTLQNLSSRGIIFWDGQWGYGYRIFSEAFEVIVSTPLRKESRSTGGAR